MKTLVERVYPALQAEAQELLALNQFLAQIEDPQLAFGVRQKTPTTVDAAVAATLELETYMKPKIAALPTAQIEQLNEDAGVIAVATRSEMGGAQDPLNVLLEKMDKLIDAKLSARESSRPRGRSGRHPRTVTCWNCQEEGHIARNCPAKNQGNGRPSEQ